MSLTSFLTQNPAEYAPSTSQSYTSLPSWYSDYASDILAQGTSYANQGAPIYPGPEVAPLTSDQLASYQTVEGQQGVGSGIAQQGVNEANSALALPSAYSAGDPYLTQASSTLSGALGMPNAAEAASPYMSEANTPISSEVSQFMNPYSQDVAQASTNLTNTLFNQQVMPALQNQFTQAGQVYGGSNQGVYAAELGSQLAGQETAANANTLAAGYNTGLSGAEAQQSAYGNLANTASNAANAAQGTQLYGAGLQSGLGSTAGSLANSAQSTALTGASTLGSLGTTEENNALNQATLQNEMGQQEQAQTQANYNTGYNNYMTQYNAPLTNAQSMESLLSGIQTPTGTTGYNYSLAGMGTSPLASGLGSTSSIYSLLSELGLARGGPVRHKARGGLNLPLNGGAGRLFRPNGAGQGFVRQRAMAKGGRVRGTLHPRFYSPLHEALVR